MATKIFVNLPVKNLNRSVEFFKYLGFTFDPRFTDENGTCMIVGENIYVMLLAEHFFETFTKKTVSDATRSTEVLIAIDAESRQYVDDMVRKAVEAGGSIYADPQDQGWMYGHSFADPDGHQWEVLFMDESALAEQIQNSEDIPGHA